MKKICSTLLISTVFVLSLLSGCGSGGNTPDQPAESTPPKLGTSSLGNLASFSAATLDGGTFTQDDIQEKDVTVINFWLLTCGPCIAEMPDLAQFSNSLPDNVQLITVCLDGSGDEALTKEILQEVGFEGTTLLSGDGDFEELCKNLLYTPTTIFVNSEGIVADNVITGRRKDLSGTFLAAVNQVLEADGKDVIGLEQT